MKRPAVLLLLAALVAGASSASAAPVLVGLDHFNNASVITFDELTDGTAIANQYAAQGVTFSAGLFATDGFAPIGIGASNGDPGTAQDITLTFAPHMVRVGFEIITKDADKTQFLISAFLNGILTQTGSFVIDTKFERLFVGFEDADNFIDKIVINAFGADGNTPDAPFIINDLRTQVPEPASMALLGLGLAGFAARRRRAHTS